MRTQAVADSVPLATIAAEAGVGVGTLYRKYPDRAGLMQALEHRAYGLVNDSSPGRNQRHV
jgi:AcrR family transcriptional regulator